MSTTGDLPGRPGNELDGEEDAVFDELARRAGAALRRPAPADGVRVIAARQRRQHTLKAGAVGGVAVAALIGALVIVSNRDDPDTVAPVDTAPATVPVTTTPAPTPTTLPPTGVFLGSWTATDADASLQTMEIRAAGDGAVEMTVHDSAASVCSGAASTMTGTGQFDRLGDLVIAAPLLVCDDGTAPAVESGPPLDEQLANLTFTHDAASDEISDSFGVVWRRDGVREDDETAPTTSGDLETAPAASPFVGGWELSDRGGRWQTMEIAASGGGSLQLTIHDDAAAVCSGGASTTTGVGRIDSNGELRAVEVFVTAPQLTCDDGSAPLDLSPPIDEQPRDFRLFHDAESDELGEVVANNVWFWSRMGTDDEPAPAPTPYQPDSAARAPDGWVAFVGVDGIVDDVYVVRGGVQPRRVDVPGSDTRTETCPAFAPDGKRLVFGRASGIDRAGESRDGFVDAELVVVTVNDDGSTSEPETIPLDGMAALPCPIWAPDGRWVAFGGAGAVWVVDTQTGETRRLPDYDPTDLEWRPGSDELAITGQGPELPGSDAPIDLYSVSAGTTRTLGDVRAAYLTWSPDGATLAFRHGEPVRDDSIWLVDSDGQNLRRLSEGADRAVHGIDVVWSPRGDQIAFQRRRGCCEASDVVLVTAADTDPANPIGTQHVIAPPPQSAVSDWLPFSVTWSPDGSHLLYVAWTWDGDEETQGVIAVPIEGDEPPFVLAQANVSVHGGTPWIPLQQWQPVAASPSS